MMKVREHKVTHICDVLVGGYFKSPGVSRFGQIGGVLIRFYIGRS